MNPIKIFISSVQKEFASERIRIYDYIQTDALLSQYFVPVLFEKMPAAAQNPNMVYLNEVRASQIYLVLLGQEYGYEDANGVSPTELEYECAKENNLYKLAFIKGDNTLERNSKQNRFISKAQNELSYKRFDNVEILISQIYAALIECLKIKGVIHTKSFDESPSEATMADISSKKVDDFVAIANAKRGFPLPKGTPAEEVLTRLKMLRDGKLCNSALLAFGNDPQYFFTTATIKCAYFLGTRWEKPIEDHKVFEGDVFEQINQAVGFVLSKINLSVGLREESVQAPIKYEIPRPVIFEAIVNSVAHRNYKSTGSVQIMVFADRIVVFNPGSLSPELTLAKIKREHGSYPTNPLLAEVLYQTGYIEKLGTGVNEMIRLSLKEGLKEPEFDFTEGVKITLWRPNDATNDATNDAGSRTEPEKQKQRLAKQDIEMLVLLACEEELTLEEISNKINRSTAHLRNRVIPDLIKSGRLSKVLPDNSPNQRYITVKNP